MSRGAPLGPALLGLAACLAMLRVAAPRDPGPAPVAAPAAALRTLECAPCHPGHDAQWRGSAHARAWSDPIVQAELADNPAPSCRGCHAPQAAAAPERGVDCAACHVRDGAILTTRRSPLGALVHPLRVDPGLARVDACAGCHQFTFADDGVHDPREPLQDTVREWQRSRFGPGAAAERPCQRCHMPRVDGGDGPRSDHRLRGLDDADLLAGAVTARARARRRGDAITVEVELRGARIGHAFPTGDVFREAVLEVRSDGGASDRLALRRWFARTLDDDGDDHHLRQVDDTRVPPPGDGALREQLALVDPAATRVSWQLRLHRLPPATARARGLAEHVDGVPVAGGILEVEP